MTRRVEAALLVLALMATAGSFAVLAILLPTGERLVPFVVALTTFVLLALELAAVLRPGTATSKTSERQDRRGRERVELSWLALLVLLLLVVGMAVGLPAYVLLYLRVRAGLRWRSAAAFALALWIVLWWGLRVLLRLPLYEGWLRL